ncbi:hypothetical protein McpAg1_11500 [Methanocorpusculaceae archaeon Ag1]|uniref:Uncharacterized protein n=1 Tax=Methanorbis furvi TaxID=3028299 RepID=A0AAE4SA48_9EURY|nr:hypothetical protein [Methanocorpusculaceae archaeon Ag1]
MIADGIFLLDYCWCFGVKKELGEISLWFFLGDDYPFSMFVDGFDLGYRIVNKLHPF